ncbi:unnamed protein product [Didymodactylos carnosus]|uniref:Uncharacterized protein n=1 Tax=Didymodactylos carnosus TaxID=1234261 RepID=A0A8S2D2D0_9BILA|nr:unnamed protein product [Didymodactylos carnosus]CAF3579094.1 unnamed protein product [Didymodactylos carnosus]
MYIFLGLFAADTLQEVKQIRNHNVNISQQMVHHQNNHQQQSLDIVQNNDYRSGLPYKTIQRNGFRPSNVKHHPSHNNQTRSLDDLPSNASRSTSAGSLPVPPSTSVPKNRSFIDSRTSAKLKIGVDEMSKKFKKNKEILNLNEDIQMLVAKRLREDRLIFNGASQASPSIISSTSSCRLSSASTVSAPLQHERYSSAITNATGNTITESYSTSATTVPSTVGPSHSYQVPQLSNVGSESVILRKNPKSRNKPPVACPYYVMYFTQMYLKKEQKDAAILPKNNSNSRNSVPLRRAGRTSSQSILTYNSAFDDQRWIDYKQQNSNNNKDKEVEQQSLSKLSNGMAMFENETVQQLQDLLRTSSWNHIQV